MWPAHSAHVVEQAVDTQWATVAEDEALVSSLFLRNTVAAAFVFLTFSLSLLSYLQEGLPG